MIKRLSPFVSIIRLGNVLMTGFAVILGIWLSGTLSTAFRPVLLMVAAMSAASFGNVINDLLDIETDRISHPERPLAKGSMKNSTAVIFAVLLVAVSLLSSFLVSPFHWKATFFPLILLSVYSFHFKKTPLIGNLLVASLVAYALLFGVLPKPEYEILVIPALLAFLLNFCREIVKDIQDEQGDRNQGYNTTAVLHPVLLKGILLLIGAVYLALLFLPSLYQNHFGNVYTGTCLLLVLPLHFYWSALILKRNFSVQTPRIASVLKLEMLGGLLALSLDKIVQMAVPAFTGSF
ncbi:MAG: geranylgeranylglycerol-phosphate geranylgeranyltransferase [Fibrobacterota bacterium]